MKDFIDGVNFAELEVQKYWQHPSSQRDRAKDEIKNMIFSGNYIGSLKVDGAYYLFVKDEDGNMTLRGRSESVNGGYINKIGHVPQLHSFFESLPNGTCLCGELYLPSKEGSRHTTTIMGCLEAKALERQNKGEKLHYYIFDVLAYNGKSLIKKNIEDRVEQLYKVFDDLEYESEIEFAKYYTGDELWDKLQECLTEGREGIVMTKIGTCYQPGKRPARQTLKVKKEISSTIDCFFTGRGTEPTRLYNGKELETWQYWENERTGEKIQGNLYGDYMVGCAIVPVTKPYFFGWCGSLEIGLVKDGKVVPIGLLSGLSEDLKADPMGQKGKVIEVMAMQIEKDTMALRHAKMVQFRPDKNWKDCEWEQLEELK